MNAIVDSLLAEREMFESIFATIEALLAPSADTASIVPHAYRLAQAGRVLAEQTGALTAPDPT